MGLVVCFYSCLALFMLVSRFAALTLAFLPSPTQRARFKAVESLKNCDPAAAARTVVVATDVAARGLDLPTVSTVIHYDAARTMDTFVHRSGRTAVSQ